ncbi:MAG: glycosyltransferase family 4 protein [Lentisphaerae bacterium]|jgi:glycosyltransferase involved in cell wall biosynthesis|nr:glycosyltransferase family 4 protein [Lentisphaerota bacterium]
MNPLRVILVSTVPSDRVHGSMVRYGAMIRTALECHASATCTVEELQLSPPLAWLRRFPARLREPVRYAAIVLNARRLLPQVRDGLLHLLDGSHAYLLAATGALRVPLVIAVHDLIPALCLRGHISGPRPGRGAAWITQRAIRSLARADHLMTVSENSRADVLRLSRIPPEQVSVVHSAVPELTASANTADCEPNAKPYLLHVAGNNNFYKNRPGVVRVFNEVRRSFSVDLKLIGPPPDAAMREVLQSSNRPEGVEFLPDVTESELAALYRGAALFLFPSLYEGFGWPPLEAMSCGCPVVCSDVASLPEIVGDAALLAPPTDVAGLAAHCGSLLHDPILRARLTAAGRAQAARFTHERLAEGLLKVYERAETHFISYHKN